jgi:ATP-dependent Clp protease ATP-binding subunit ClpB
MSEYHDRYTVSRLIGAAPGLVGYEEGGTLLHARYWVSSEILD